MCTCVELISLPKLKVYLSAPASVELQGHLHFVGGGDCNTSEPSTCGLDPHPEQQKAMANHYCIFFSYLFFFFFLLSIFFTLKILC